MISPGHEATVGDHSGTFVPQKWVQPGPVFCTLMPEKDSRILILGGGFGGLFTALDLAGAGNITLVSDEDHFLFKPMLYEYLSGEVEAWHIAPNYSELLDESVRIVRGAVESIDLDGRSVTVAGQK